MRVLHIGKYSPPFFGGIENVMMDLAEACNEHGIESAAIVHHHQSGQTFDCRQMAGITVYRVPCYGKLMFAPVSPAFGVYLKQVIEEFKPDVLHIHMPNTSAFFALLYAQAKGLPWVVHWHSDVLGEDSPWFLKTFYPLYRPFETAVLKRAKKVIATSQAYLNSSIALNRFQQKCKVIGLGIKPPEGLSQQVRQRQKDQPLQLLVVGRLTYYKGHKYLIDALGLLKQQGLGKIKLNIVGGGELEPALQQQIKARGLANEVQLLGKLSNEQLHQQFLAADCLCLVSIERTEAFGVVLMEAAAYGVPAIVTDVPGSGMSWAVQDGQTGLVVKRADAGALANGIKRLYMQPKLLEQFSQGALSRFERHFKISEVARQVVGVYRSL